MTEVDNIETKTETKSEELPRQLGRVKPRWLEKASEGSDTDTKTKLLVGTDTVTGREVDIARVPFGLERIVERDAFVDAMKARTAITVPSLVAVHDAGEWDVDAFVATDRIEGLDPLEQRIASLSIAERVRVAKGLAEAVATLEAHGLACTKSMLDEAEMDPYRQVRLRALATAKAGVTEPEVVEALRAWCERLAEVAGEVSAEDAHTLHLLRAPFTSVGELQAQLKRLSPSEPETPLLHVTMSPEASKRAQNRVLVIGLTLFLLAFVVLAGVLLTR
jgi:hypothetical protein